MVDESRVLTCVYCGHKYPQDTPAWGDQVLTDHIRICPKHPLRAVEAERDRLHSLLDVLIKAADKYSAEHGFVGAWHKFNAELTAAKEGRKGCQSQERKNGPNTR